MCILVRKIVSFKVIEWPILFLIQQINILQAQNHFTIQKNLFFIQYSLTLKVMQLLHMLSHLTMVLINNQQHLSTQKVHFFIYRYIIHTTDLINNLQDYHL